MSIDLAMTLLPVGEHADMRREHQRRTNEYCPWPCHLSSFVFAISAIALTLPPLSNPPSKSAFNQDSSRVQLGCCFPDYRPVTELGGEVRIVGADTMEKLATIWTEAFTRVYPYVRFQMESQLSTKTAAALTSGTTQMAAVARELLPSEIESFRTRFGYDPAAIKVAGGSFRTIGKTPAIAFFVHKDNPLKGLSLRQLDAVLSKTRLRGGKKAVTRWGQLGLDGDWKDKPIVIYGVKRPNGIPSFVQQAVLNGGEFRDGIHEIATGSSLDSIIRAIAADRFGIGYAGFGNATAEVRSLALSESDDHSYVEGNLATVASHEYPLSRYVYIFVNRTPDAPLDAVSREFLRFILSRQGQEAVIKEGVFLLLPPEVAVQEHGKLE